MVFFEAPHRTAEMLAAAAEQLGADRRGVICRELTKTYEEVVRGGLGELADWAAGGVRGEVTIVIAGTTPDPAADLVGAVEQVQARVTDGVRLKEAVAEVAAATGVRKNALYDAALEARVTR